jgi:alpha-beta hydrolase superfamily lysophospholipase
MSTPDILTLSSRGGVPLHATWWTPAQGDPKAVVVRIHGLGEHAGRHVHVAQRLVDAGYAVAMVDLRGHGRSGGTRGHTPIEGALDDIDALLDLAAERAPGLPVYLFGHSLGGLFALLEVMRRPRAAVAGVVVSAPALRSPVLEQRVKMTAAKRLGSVAPFVTMPTGLDDSGLSRDAAVVQAYRDDPYVHGVASLRLAKDGAEGAQWVLEHAGEITLPLLILHGSADPITYPSGSRELAAALPAGADVTLTMYDGVMHEPHNEPEQQQVLDDVVAWLDAHVSAA